MNGKTEMTKELVSEFRLDINEDHEARFISTTRHYDNFVLERFHFIALCSPGGEHYNSTISGGERSQ